MVGSQVVVWAVVGVEDVTLFGFLPGGFVPLGGQVLHDMVKPGCKRHIGGNHAVSHALRHIRQDDVNLLAG